MAGWLIGRISQAALVMLAMSLIVFVAIFAVGDPVSVLISPEATQAERQRIIESLGLDRPLWEQYGRFLGQALQGNLGLSYVYNAPPIPIVLHHMAATLELAFTALLLSCLFGIPLGLHAGLRPQAASSKAIMSVSVLGFSMPSFWIGIVFIMVFAVHLGWLPSQGRGETVEVFGIGWSFLTTDGLRHLVLPALTLSLASLSLVIRLTAAGTREVAGLDYIKFARAKGLPERRIVGVHLLKNILIPITTVVGIDLGYTIAFSVVTETIYSWPGMGKLLIDSIAVLDRPLIVSYLLVVVVLFVAINFVVDLIYTLLDPRLRLGERH